MSNLLCLTQTQTHTHTELWPNVSSGCRVDSVLCSECSDSEWRSQKAHLEVESSTSSLKWPAFMLHIVPEPEEAQKTEKSKNYFKSVSHLNKILCNSCDYNFITSGSLFILSYLFCLFLQFHSDNCCQQADAACQSSRFSNTILASGWFPICSGQGTCRDTNLAMRRHTEKFNCMYMPLLNHIVVTQLPTLVNIYGNSVKLVKDCFQTLLLEQ